VLKMHFEKEREKEILF